MWKWMVGAFLVVLALTFYLQHQVGDIGQEPVARPKAAAVPAVMAPEPAEETDKVMVHSVAQERLMNRVPVVHEGPIKDEILPQ
ncbi:MAG: hypothetical protein HQL22_00545 [Candidatus Omnitrophica bacterium]|nr:hypothetical protein [Candidatus Omnitrophota bacterium]